MEIQKSILGIQKSALGSQKSILKIEIRSADGKFSCQQELEECLEIFPRRYFLPSPGYFCLLKKWSTGGKRRRRRLVTLLN